VTGSTDMGAKLRSPVLEAVVLPDNPPLPVRSAMPWW
jgi:hypothetical protein